jgi:hypothetical protein
MSTPPDRQCGSCSLCCKILRVDELDKPMDQWCGHFKSGQGCSIHGSHPQSCRNYHCMWIISPAMPQSARPDRSKVMFSLDDDGRRIIARADPDFPDAWRQNPIHGQLRAWAGAYWFKGRTIWAMVGKRMWLIAPDRDIDIGETDERSPTSYTQGPTGRIQVTILPPLPEGEDYDPEKAQAQLAAGEGRVVFG